MDTLFAFLIAVSLVTLITHGLSTLIAIYQGKASLGKTILVCILCALVSVVSWWFLIISHLSRLGYKL